MVFFSFIIKLLGYLDIVQQILPLYINKISENVTSDMPPSIPKSEQSMIQLPMIAAVMYSDKNLEIVRLMASKLSKPFISPFIKSDSAQHFTDNIGFLETSIFYNKPHVTEELLKIPEYHEYAHNNIEKLVNYGLKAGSYKIIKKLAQFNGYEFKISHLHSALEHCNNEDCKDILYSLLSKHPSTEILDFKDERGNTILHLLASYGRKQFLFDLIDSGVFDFRNSAPHRARLLAKNADRLCPYAIAIQNELLDISNALFVNLDSIDELSDEEFNIISSALPTTKALTEFLDEKKYPIEAKLWAILIPNRSAILNLLEKTSKVILYNKRIPMKNPHVKEVIKKESVLQFLINSIKEGKIGEIIKFLIFRKDLLQACKLLSDSFMVKANLFMALAQNSTLLPLAYVLAELGLAPNTNAELFEFFNKNKIKDDNTILFMMQILEIFKYNSEESFQNLENAKPGSLFIEPYTFFVGKKEMKIGSQVFTLEEFACLIQHKKQAPKTFGLDLSNIGHDLFVTQHYRSFMAILLYTYQYDQTTFDKIMKERYVEQLVDWVLSEHPEDLVILHQIMPSKLSITLNPKSLDFYLTEDKETNFRLIDTKNSMPALLYYALFAAQKSVNVENSNSVNDTIRQIMKYVLFNMMKIYGENRAFCIKDNADTEEKKEENHMENINYVIEINQTKRALLNLVDLIKRLYELMNSESKLSHALTKVPANSFKLLISENELAEILSEMLNPTGLIFHTGSGFMTVSVDSKEILETSKVLATGLKKPLLEALCLLFTDQYILGIIEHKDQTEKYTYDIHVKFGKESGMVPVKCDIKSFEKTKFSAEHIKNSTFLNTKMRIYKKPIECYKAVIDLTLSQTQSKLVQIPTEFEKINDDLNREFMLRIFDLLPPMKIEVKDLPIIQLSLDNESVRKHCDELEKMFYVDISMKLRELCKNEINGLLEKLRYSIKECEFITVPTFINELNIPNMPENIKSILTGKISKSSVINICLQLTNETEKKSIKENPIEIQMIESLHRCLGKIARIENAKLCLMLPKDLSMQTPENYLAHEMHPEFYGYRILLSEARAIRKITSMNRQPPPYIRIDMENFIKNIALPISKAAAATKNLRYTHPLLVIEEFFNFSFIFPTIMKKIINQMNEMKQKFGRDISSIVLSFEEGKKESKLLFKEFPLIDQIIRITDCEIKGYSHVCEIKFQVDNFYNTKGLVDILPDGDVGSLVANMTKEPDKREFSEYINYMTHEVKILESLFTEAELFEKLLERKPEHIEKLSQIVSNILGKKANAQIDWKSLYELLKSDARPKESFENLNAYYSNVFFSYIKKRKWNYME